MAKAEGQVPAARSDDPSEAFFARLIDEPEQPLLKRVSGVVRVDVADGPVVEHWALTIDDGHVTVARRKVRTDTVVYVDKALFHALATGAANGMAAFLRGEMTAQGDLRLVMRLQRLFPGPALGARRMTRAAAPRREEVPA